MENDNIENNTQNQSLEHIPDIQLDPKYELAETRHAAMGHEARHDGGKKVIRTLRQDHARTVLVAACSALAVIIIALGIVYTFRHSIFASLANSYVATSNVSSNNDTSSASLFSDENIVTGAVKKANPAVVAITISKDVPKYETIYNTPGNDPFGFFFQVPQQRQNGTEKQEVGSGSGFLVSADGYIVTNRHVAEDEKAEYTVTLNDGRKKTAKVIAADKVYDIAIIKIEGSGYPFLELADSGSLQLGSTVIAIGNALGQFKNTVSVGVVSGLSRSITAGDGAGRSEQLEQVIQTDAAINPGNSGGPLLNIHGEVIGVNVAVAQGSQSIGFALPINSVKGVIASVQATGKISRPYIGVRYTLVTPDLVDKEKLSVDHGVLVQGNGDDQPAVIKNSPGAKAGIKEGDIITHFDGKELDDTNSLSLMVREHKVGDSVSLKIVRNGTTRTVQVKLEEAPTE